MHEPESTNASSSAYFHPGQIVGKRFELLQPEASKPTWSIWQARDTQTSTSMVVHFVHPAVVPSHAMNSAIDLCRQYAALTHPSVAKTFGVGKTSSGALMMINEAAQGHALARTIRDRTLAGATVSLGGTYNVIAHLAEGCRAYGKVGPHGALRPNAVRVSGKGDVKLDGFGICSLLLTYVGAQAFEPLDQVCLAPEVRAGEAATSQSDVFGLGAILYQLLTGRTPEDDFVPPSQARNDVPPSVDEVLLRCLAAEPGDRFESTHEVEQALVSDLVVRTSMAPPPSKKMPAEINVPLHSIVPPAGLDVSIVTAFSRTAAGAAAPPPIAAAPSQPNKGKSTGSPSHDELAEVLKRLNNDSSARWMVTQSGFDYGPFKSRELVERIAEGEFQADDELTHIDSGDKKSLIAWPDFAPFVHQYKKKATRDAERRARQSNEVNSRRATKIKSMLTVGALCVAAFGVYQFLQSRKDSENNSIGQAELAALNVGKVKIRTDSRDRHERARRRNGSADGSGNSGGAFTTYEAAMSRAVRINAESNGGEAQLSGSQVASVMNRSLNRMYERCAAPEVQSHGPIGKVVVDLAIAGSGDVLGASVRQGSGTFRNCITSEVQRINFPSFEAPRIGARYSFRAE